MSLHLLLHWMAPMAHHISVLWRCKAVRQVQGQPGTQDNTNTRSLPFSAFFFLLAPFTEVQNPPSFDLFAWLFVLPSQTWVSPAKEERDGEREICKFSQFKSFFYDVIVQSDSEERVACQEGAEGRGGRLHTHRPNNRPVWVIIKQPAGSFESPENWGIREEQTESRKCGVFCAEIWIREFLGGFADAVMGQDEKKNRETLPPAAWMADSSIDI